MINKQTTLDLNGPVLSFTQQPSSVTVNDTGNATFVGLATATFPTQDPSNPSTNTGTISYRWYDQNGPLSDGSNVNGSTTTTLTLSNLRSPGDNGRRVYLKADYIPSAYGLTGVAVTVGSARSTGNAANDTLNSNTAIITVNSLISITRQPSSSTVIQGQRATFVVSAITSNGTSSGLSYQWLLNGAAIQDSSTVSGATTPTLSISSNNIGSYTIQVRISHPTASNSPILSNSVQFGVTAPPLGITIETINDDNATASIQSYNLETNNNITLLGRNYTSRSTLLSLYAPSRDVDVEMDIYGGKGANYGSFQGGTGGYSRIRFTMKQNEEYVIAGLNNVDNCPFLYRKGKLIAVVGTGGNASTNGNGGNGGGINLEGGNAAAAGSRQGGTGGIRLSSGQISVNGVFGSTSSTTPISPDSKAGLTNGGTTSSCPRGDYWRNLGFSPCQEVGNVKFFNKNGIEIANTAKIDRGYKAGYNIRQTAGAGAPSATTPQLIQRTCTRTVPQTCYREASQPVFQNITVTDNRGSISYTGLSVTGLSINITRYNNGAFGTEGNFPGIIGYYIDVVGLSDPSMSISVLDTRTRASGLIDTNSSISVISGYPISLAGYSYRFMLAFDMISPVDQRWGGRQATYCRSWSISLSGTKTFQEAYDCSFNESYDCSYTVTVPLGGGGHGGNGAVGGGGGQASAGGGGGSGYTDGSVTVVSTATGGSAEAKVVIRSVTSTAPSPTLIPAVPSLASLFYRGTVLSVKPGAGTVGSVTGFTNGNGLSGNGFRYNAPTTNYFMELRVANNNWISSSGWIGVCDETHWNALTDSNYTTTLGRRLMWYIGADFAFGEQTGSSLQLYTAGRSVNLVNGDILGIVVNRDFGRVAIYINGEIAATIFNSSAAGTNLYVTVGDWFFQRSLSCNALQSYSEYAVNYKLP